VCVSRQRPSRSKKFAAISWWNYKFTSHNQGRLRYVRGLESVLKSVQVNHLRVTCPFPGPDNFQRSSVYFAGSPARVVVDFYCHRCRCWTLVLKTLPPPGGPLWGPDCRGLALGLSGHLSPPLRPLKSWMDFKWNKFNDRNYSTCALCFGFCVWFMAGLKWNSRMFMTDPSFGAR